METNTELELAWRCVVQTGTHLFLTGKAGTGKTTFLHQLKTTSPKRMVVLAPTGIAAINAGGVTIHSFFQLPFAPYIPGTEFATDTKYQFNKEKINIIRSLDLLVIDEVSMVRADLLDSVDAILRRYRRTTVPFGGVQLLLIGDLHQLSPVIKEEERRLLEAYYPSSYFFNSKALQKTAYLTIELKQVYRQSEKHFLDLLNQIRDNKATSTTLEELNKRYIPDFVPPAGEEYIRLTTHNYQAQTINDQHLAKISSPAFSYKAQVNGNFPQHAYPADELLTIKEGAQIMFIKNDVSFPKRFYNGKIGKVTHIDEHVIEVQTNDDPEPFSLQKAVWTNAKYVLNKETNEISEDIEGTFEQYPIRLAWAITIHKSQGLTFDKAIIDIASSFAHGQTYVALSRCRTLNGMVLNSPISHRAIIKDAVIHDFVQQSATDAPDESKIAVLERAYFSYLVTEMVQFSDITKLLVRGSYLFKESPLIGMYPSIHEQLKQSIEHIQQDIEQVSSRFLSVFFSMFRNTPDYQDNAALQERIQSAASYFLVQLNTLVAPLIAAIKVDVDNKETEKQVNDLHAQLSETLQIHTACLSSCKNNGFSVSAYQKAKLEAAIEHPSTKKRTAKASEKQKVSINSGETEHAQLYEHLRAWRLQEASERKLPAYAILHQKALLGIVQHLPLSPTELLQIPHLGKRTVTKFGDALIEIVREFVQSKENDKTNS